MIELVVPDHKGIAKPDEVYAFERDVREHVLSMELSELTPGLAKVEELAKALKGTKLSPPAQAAARRVEYRIGQLLGPGPGKGPGRGKTSVGTDVLDADQRYEFRQLATLDGALPWDDLNAWAKSRPRLLKVAKERQRKPGAKVEIRRGRFQEVLTDLVPGSVSLILTDPPYAEDAIPHYRDLAEFGREKLCDGGSLICFTGQGTMPLALEALSSHLRYWWTLALEHRGGGQQLPGKWVRIKWKPILWFVKDGRRDKTYVHDILRGVKPSKETHEWAQGVDEVVPLIEGLTSPDELVVDPFAGSGSFGIAATRIGRRFIGADDR